jgi:cell division septum initiation protein DivIVA
LSTSNLNKGHTKTQSAKAKELNTDFGGAQRAAKDTNTAIEIPLNWVKFGAVKIKFLTIKLEFNEAITDGVYVKSVYAKDVDTLLAALANHMQVIAHADSKDTRTTAEYGVCVNGTNFRLTSTERPAKETDAAKLLGLAKWVTREGHTLSAESKMIPSYLYLLDKPSVIFECEGHKVQATAKEAARWLVDIADNAEGIDSEKDHVLNVLKDKIQTSMYKGWRKEKDEDEGVQRALDAEIERMKKELERERERLEREELEKELGTIKTEVIKKAGRYEALMVQVKDKVALLNGLRGKSLDVLLEVQGALAQGDKDRAIVLGFGVEETELKFLKECHTNKDNLVWMKENKGKFEAPQG